MVARIVKHALQLIDQAQPQWTRQKTLDSGESAEPSTGIAAVRYWQCVHFLDALTFKKTHSDLPDTRAFVQAHSRKDPRRIQTLEFNTPFCHTASRCNRIITRCTVSRSTSEMNPIDIPALAQMPTLSPPAPAIIRGTPVDSQDFVRAVEDVVERAVALRGRNAAVTNTDVALAATRTVAVANVHAKAMYAAPPWAVQILEIVRDIQRRVTNIELTVTNTNTRVANLETKLTSMGEKVTNIGTILVNTDTKSTSMGEKITNIETKLTNLEAMVANLETAASIVQTAVAIAQTQATGAQDTVQRISRDVDDACRIRQQETSAMLAYVWNTRAQLQNRVCMRGSVTRHLLFMPLRKVNSGVGAGLPGYIDTVSPPLPLLRVGDIVPAPFSPANNEAIE